MKNQLLIIGCCLLFGSSIFGQSVPQGMNYQAVARDLTGQILADQEISVKLILKSGDSDENNATAYTEIHYVKTNAFGLINLVVGEGSVVKGKFSHIPWSSQNIWMDISIDNAGGENYEHLTTSKLLTVPYAFHAATASSLTEDIIDREDLQKKKAKKEWRTEGNKDIDSSENYLGTLDAAPLIVITNDSPRLIVHSDGAIEIMGEVTAASFVGDGSQLSGINSDDADSDPSNEYNTALALSGTQLDITDGGATLSADLSSLEESAEVEAAQADATQALSAAYVSQTTANDAVVAASLAQSSADNAQDSADNAETNANQALSNAADAQASAVNAQADATQGINDAAHAQAAANMAQATADNAQNDATQAISDAANAQASANMAQTTADNAQSDATQGINDAAHAQSSANIAQTTADGAQTDATQAITDAANAQATANNAAQAIDQHAVDDADTDNTNELNSSFALTGNNLEIADASGTLSVDLSALDNADDAAHAQAAANMAQATADNAQNDATQAISDAANAQASANMAQTTADNAQSDATQGINNAANAQAMANHAANAIDQHALDDADTDNTNELNSSFALTGNNLEIADASGTLSVDLSVLDNADDAMAAQSAANQALAEALAAQAAANQALLDAMAAQQKADDAIASASLAQNTANTANSTAGQALSSATSAQSAANSAQITATQGLSAAAIAHNKIDSHVSVDQDLSSTNEIELPAGGQQGQLLSTDGNGTYNWTDDNGITVNAQNNELTAWNGNSLVGSSVTRTSSGINVNGNINATSANLSGILISGAINTGLGTTEVHLMNQNLRSNDDVSFNSMNLSRLSINNKWFFTDSNNSEWLYLRNQANNAYFGGIAVGKFYSEGTARVRGNTGLDADLSVEGTTNLNGQVNISGVDLNTLIDQKVRNYVRSRCYIRFGWRDSANGQLTPSKYVKVRADKSAWEYCTDCTAGDGWASVNADGDVNGDDNFYIQFECL